jgi:16S rRNA (cytosine1402-N4)-methyltransferase
MSEGTDFGHEPVLQEEAVGYLRPRPGGRYVDATLGAGGHARRVLAAAEVELLGLDRDEEALEASRQALGGSESRVHLARGSFADLAEPVAALGWEQVDGVLFDLGVSSMQLDRPDRGFSHRTDGPLDMRMDRRNPTTAATLLDHTPEADLARIFREFGEEPRAAQVARAIVARRAERPWTRTGELADLIRAVTASEPGRLRRTAPARVFQALRMAVNDELGQLEAALPAAVRLLAPEGRLVVISFHSLEDRLVKQFLVREAQVCVCPPGLPECRCGKVATVKVLTKHPIRPGAAEVERNPRAAPARLRAAERLAPAD